MPHSCRFIDISDHPRVICVCLNRVGHSSRFFHGWIPDSNGSGISRILWQKPHGKYPRSSFARDDGSIRFKPPDWRLVVDAGSQLCGGIRRIWNCLDSRWNSSPDTGWTYRTSTQDYVKYLKYRGRFQYFLLVHGGSIFSII